MLILGRASQKTRVNKSDGLHEFMSYHRYSDFKKLDKTIKTMYGGALPEMESSTLKIFHTTALKEKRTATLEQILDELEAPRPSRGRGRNKGRGRGRDRDEPRGRGRRDRSRDDDSGDDADDGDDGAQVEKALDVAQMQKRKASIVRQLTGGIAGLFKAIKVEGYDKLSSSARLDILCWN